MDFADRMQSLVTRVRELKDHAQTEEATKTSLVLPFIQALGYDAFDPRVVVPEFTCDVGMKKGEKVDYAIRRNGEIIMLIEAKCVGDALDASRASQLHRYFHNTSAKIAILTDGVVYQFFTDLEKPNVMDEKPFMIFDFSAVEPPLVDELKKLCNDCFDAEVALGAAQDLKYLRQIKLLVAQELAEPSDDFVKHFAKKVHSGNIWSNLLDGFRERVKIAFEHHINDIINARLQGAIQPNTYAMPQAPESGSAMQEEADGKQATDIVTTEEEIEGYHIVKALLREVVALERVGIRDTLHYCNVLLDDKNTKPICRFYFNAQSVKHLELVGEDKKWTKHKIESLNDIFRFADELKATALRYG